jgi:hypothetical protein
MKKTFLFAVLLSLVVAFTNANAGGPNYDKEIIGSWQFDMGGGIMAGVEYRTDNSFVQKMGDMTVAGTYKIKGNKLTTVVNKKTAVFTIKSIEGKKMILVRDTDKKTVEYLKK